MRYCVPVSVRERERVRERVFMCAFRVFCSFKFIISNEDLLHRMFEWRKRSVVQEQGLWLEKQAHNQQTNNKNIGILHINAMAYNLGLVKFLQRSEKHMHLS